MNVVQTSTNTLAEGIYIIFGKKSTNRIKQVYGIVAKSSTDLFFCKILIPKRRRLL